MFETGIKIFLLLGLAFFVGFSFTFLMWTDRKMTRLRNILGAMLLNLLFLFKILFYGTLLLILIFLVIKFLPF